MAWRPQRTMSGSQLADGAGQDVAGGQRVGGGGAAVGDQDRPRRRRGYSDSRSTSQAAGGPMVTTVTVPPCRSRMLEGLFEGVEVLGVEDGRQGGPVDRAVVLHRLAGDPLGVRHLLDEDDDTKLSHGRVDFPSWSIPEAVRYQKGRTPGKAGSVSARPEPCPRRSPGSPRPCQGPSIGTGWASPSSTDCRMPWAIPSLRPARSAPADDTRSGPCDNRGMRSRGWRWSGVRRGRRRIAARLATGLALSGLAALLLAPAVVAAPAARTSAAAPAVGGGGDTLGSPAPDPSRPDALPCWTTCAVPWLSGGGRTVPAAVPGQGRLAVREADHGLRRGFGRRLGDLRGERRLDRPRPRTVGRGGTPGFPGRPARQRARPGRGCPGLVGPAVAGRFPGCVPPGRREDGAPRTVTTGYEAITRPTGEFACDYRRSDAGWRWQIMRKLGFEHDAEDDVAPARARLRGQAATRAPAPTGPSSCTWWTA